MAQNQLLLIALLVLVRGTVLLLAWVGPRVVLLVVSLLSVIALLMVLLLFLLLVSLLLLVLLLSTLLMVHLGSHCQLVVPLLALAIVPEVDLGCSDPVLMYSD